jgi:hypothetical protein
MVRIEWSQDVTAANWLVERLHPFGQDTGSIVPEGFDAYCRVFHPNADTGERWSDIAARNGRVAHAEMQFHLISRPAGTPADRRDPGNRGTGPEWGSLPVAQRRALIDLLRPGTTSPGRCWFCLWDGWGGLDLGVGSARVLLPGRDYLLYAGPIDLALQPPPQSAPPGFVQPQSPNLWWPEDLAWVVATEIDYAWTYVGGSRALIDGLLADPRLEALSAQLSDKPFFDSDVINYALDGTGPGQGRNG